ncbi:MAG: insulinase family protein [Clostridiales bacterium]|nr:insulinase family protein [Clostridiales bacterium]
MEVRINCPSGCETIHHRLKNGAQVYILPKERNISVGAVVIGFGAADTEFKYDGRYYRIPYGTAHFLEHQMFEMPTGSAAAQFTSLGAESNAFTDAGKKVYYFKTAENFTECFRLLLDMVKTPYFEGGSVENERNIIKSEIDMYDDDPNWKAFFGAARQLYPESPISCEIAGNAESIAKIRPDVLYTCHEAFYTPENMTIICGGDVNADDIISEAERILGRTDKRKAEVKCLKTEPAGGEAEYNMDITLPRFCAVYPVEPKGGKAERIFLLRLLADYAFGEGSEFYKKLSESDIMNEPPKVEVYEHKGIGYFAVSGTACDTKKALDAVEKTMGSIRKNSIDERDFERELKKLTGRFIRFVDDCEAAVMAQAEFRNCSLAQIAEMMRKVTPRQLESVLDTIGEKCGVCVVRSNKN